MNRILSLILTASIGLSVVGLTAAASDHQAGEHDFGDPFAPYLDTALVLKTQIESPSTISHTSREVQGSSAVTADIIESSAQFYTRDNGDGALSDGSLESRDYGNIKNIMFAYMYEPAEAGKYPAVLFLHGGGGTADTFKDKAKDFAAKGYVTMAIDIPALMGNPGTVDVDGAAVARSSGAYKNGDGGDRFKIAEEYGGAKNSDLVDAEIGVIQAFNYLAGNAKTDVSNMGIMGSSWGGYSATLVGGMLGNKVKAVYSQYGSGFYGPTPDGTKYDSFWTDNGYFPTDEFAKTEWYSYLDPSAYLDNMTANYYLDGAAKDTFYRPKSVEATLDKAKAGAADVNHVWSYESSHVSISGSDTSYPFMDYYLKNEGSAISKTEIVKTELLPDGSNKVYINVTASAEPSSVKLVYSKNDTGYTDRVWNTVDAVKGADGYTAVLAADKVAGGVEYYALTRDSDKIAYSSSRMKTGFTQQVSVVSTPDFTLNDTPSSVIGNGTFTAKVPVINNDYAGESSVRAILALYKDGALEKVSLSDETGIAAGAETVIPVSVDIDADNIDSYRVKLMIWDGIGTMRPYDKEYSLSSVDSAPTAPENLVVTGSTIEGISMQWDAATDNIAVEGYDVYRKASGETDYEKLATLSGNALSYTDSMIEVNETYGYQIMAFDGSGNRSEAAEVQADSIEGAKVMLNQYDPENGIDIDGYMLRAHIDKDKGDGTTVTLKENFTPLQDEVARDCVEIANGADPGTGKYINLAVDDNYINEIDNRVAVMVTFDDVNFDKVKMQYNAVDGSPYKPADIYTKRNEQRWTTATYIIEDAKFVNMIGGKDDLRINFDNGAVNRIAMIQIVNLSDALGVKSASADSIELSWKNVSDAQNYELYRDGELIAEPDANTRTYTDTGLTIDTEYTYTLKAVTELDTREIATITASTLKRYIAEVDFNDGTEYNMSSMTSGFDVEKIDGLTAVTTESDNINLKLSVDNTVITGKKNYLVTFKYNDCGNAMKMRVGMTNSGIDQAHYFYTNGTGKWETAIVLIPDCQFNNNGDDIQIRAANTGGKYAITSVKLSECPSYDEGTSYLNGIVSGVTTVDGMLNTALTTFKTADDESSAEVIDYDGASVIRLNSTNVNSDGKKRSAFNIVPDYRLLGQNYKNAVLPGDEGYEERPAAVRPVTLKVTYLKNNTSGVIYIKGAKLDEENNKITNPDNDASLNLVGNGEWATAKIHIDDYYVQGTSAALNSPIQLIASGVPADEDIIIGKIEIMNRDYSTKVGEYSVEDPNAAEAITATFDDGIEERVIDYKSAMYTDRKDAFFKFAVDKSVVTGQKDRFVTITYHDGGIANTPVRVSMVNNAIDGAHYFFTRGTNRWETTTVLIPEAEFKGNSNDITIKLTNVDNGNTIAISKIELSDGNEHAGTADDIGAQNVTGIASGMTVYNGMFNTSLAAWETDAYTTLEPVTIDGTAALRVLSASDNARGEFRIVPDYRYLGLTAKSGDLPNGTVTPIKVKVTYYNNGGGAMYIKGATLKADGTGLEWAKNHGTCAIGTSGSWITYETDIDDFYMNGGSDVFRSYIQFVTNNTPESGIIIKSIEILNK